MIFRYRKIRDIDTIFKFYYVEKREADEVRPKIKYSTAEMNEEIDAMKTGISMNSDLKKYYEKQLTCIKNNPLLVRGHDAFHFLQCYLKGRHNTDLEFYGDDKVFLEKCVPQFNVKLDM